MRILWICLLWCCNITVNAGENRMVKCRFLCMDGIDAPKPVINISEKASEIYCAVPNDKPSQPVDCFAKMGTIDFLSSDDRKPAASAVIPENLSEVILVFAQGGQAGNPLPWKVFVIESFGRDFPDGGVLLANFYKHDVQFTIGTTEVTLRPGKSQVCPRPAERDNFNMVPVVFKYHLGDQWMTGSENMVRFPTENRYLFYAYPDPMLEIARISTCQETPEIHNPELKK
jgi:hypothetical protein